MSRVVKELLFSCSDFKRLHIIVTAGGLSREGCFRSPFLTFSIQFANDLQQKGIRTTLIPDSGVGYFMHTVQLVLMGAEVVVETGGVVNKLGSLQVGVLAKTFNVPVYIAVESYKFARIYPLNQKSVSVSEADRQISEKARPKELDEGVEFGAARCDYLPPEYITFLMTDLGVLAPPSVSDELIKLYWWDVCWKAVREGGVIWMLLGDTR